MVWGDHSKEGCDTPTADDWKYVPLCYAMLSKQCVLYTCTSPYLGVGVKQAVSLVG